MAPMNLLTALALLLATQEAEIVRDPWGVPHVFARTDEDAFFALGYAAAQDRGDQMILTLRSIQGRLAETIGNVAKRNRRDETALDHDRKMRTFGFHRAAVAVAKNLDAETRALLQAYADGVNRAMPDLKEPWTPADCIAVWWRFAQFFGTDGTRDYLAWKNPGVALDAKPDDRAAVVQREDVDDAWIRTAREYLEKNGHKPLPESDPKEKRPKYSHAWVVGGARTTTGSAVLCSDPQTPVANPSLLYEFHVSGKTFNARGIGVAGSPVILIGWNEDVAWGMTALGADQADLFRLKTEGGRYQIDGEWRDFEVRRETIRVKGGRDEEIEVRETCFGPVVTRFAFVDQGEVALRRVPTCETDRETIQGAIAMMRAKDIESFHRALEGWRFPSANVVFGDRAGAIGYSTVGAIPLRSPDSPEGGKAHDGTSLQFLWKGMIPHDLHPHVLQPKSGVLFSANHRPIGSFYPIPLGAGTGWFGDTVRSWRLRERLSIDGKFKPEDVLAVHYDTVNPARRDIVKHASKARASLSEKARSSLDVLEPWLKAGASMSLSSEGSALAMQIQTMFRIRATDLAKTYGGGQSGLCRWLQDLATREPAKEDLEYLDRALSDAWDAATRAWGTDPAKWNAKAKAVERTIGWCESLDGFPSLDRSKDVKAPPLDCVDGDTILSQAAQSYSQYVPLHDVDAARSLLPSPATFELWSKGELHAAPITRKGVDAIATSRTKVKR